MAPLKRFVFKKRYSFFKNTAKVTFLCEIKLVHAKVNMYN